jgi:hypothetical protein
MVHPDHKVLTYVEYRAVSGVFQNIDPFSTQRVCPPPTPMAGGGVHTRRPVMGWGVNILEDARHWIGLLQYNPSTTQTNLKEDNPSALPSTLVYCATPPPGWF